VDTNVSRWSKLELYNKYMDVSAKLREQQSINRQNDIVNQQVLTPDFFFVDSMVIRCL
jgi:hypothetical protein